jgi:cytochrome c oxidase cbb3-type subunit I/II
MSTENKHRRLEGKALTMTLMTTGLMLIGGLVEIVPMMAVKSNVPTLAEVKPLTPLELEGRDLYVREGCYNCHSQMIRPFRSETLRYGEYSRAGEFVYGRGRTWRAWAGSTPTRGTSGTWKTRSPRRRARSCPSTSGC